MRELTVTEKDCAQQLIKYLSKYMEEAPKSFFYKMLRKKNIVLNQKKADGSEKLKTGDTIRLYLAEETIEKFRKTPEKPAAGKQVKYPKLDIVYEDEKEDFDPDEADTVELINGERIPWEQVKRDGIDYIALYYVNEEGKQVQILDAELA